MNYLSRLLTFLILYTFSNSDYQKSLLFSIIIDLFNTNSIQSTNTKNINTYFDGDKYISTNAFTNNQHNINDSTDTYINTENNYSTSTDQPINKNYNKDCFQNNSNINNSLNSSNNISYSNYNNPDKSTDAHISNKNIFDNSTNKKTTPYSPNEASTSKYSDLPYYNDITTTTTENNKFTNPTDNNYTSDSKTTTNTSTNKNNKINYPTNNPISKKDDYHNSPPTINPRKKNNTNSTQCASNKSTSTLNNTNNNSDNSIKHSNEKNPISNNKPDNKLDNKLNNKLDNKAAKEKINSNNKTKYIITSSIKQIKTSDIIKVSKAKNINSAHDLPIHLPNIQLNIDRILFLVGTCNIKDVFQGSLNFSFPINNVIITSNKIIIKENYLLADNFMGTSSALFYFEGYLKTTFYTLEPINPSKDISSSIYKDNIIYTPFTISKYLNIDYLLEDEKYLLKNPSLNISQFTYETNKELIKVNSFDKPSNSYNNYKITISLDYTLNIYTK